MAHNQQRDFQEEIMTVLALETNSKIYKELGDESFMRLYFVFHKSIIENSKPTKDQYLLYLSIDKKYSLEFLNEGENILICSLNQTQLKKHVSIPKKHFYEILSVNTHDILPNMHGILFISQLSEPN
jgi:hypothetical protein